MAETPADDERGVVLEVVTHPSGAWYAVLSEPVEDGDDE